MAMGPFLVKEAPARMPRRIAPVPIVAALCVLGCGSRTGLPADGSGAPDASTDVTTSGPPDAPSDAAMTPPVDEGPPDAPPMRCTSDAACDDGIACTVDRCDLATGTCTHDADNALCPPGFVCRPPCVAASFAEDPGSLYGVDLPAGLVSDIGATRAELDDIALEPAGRTLYGVNTASGSLYEVDAKTGAATFVTTIGERGVALGINALDFAPDGTLYGAGGDVVFAIDPKTGRSRQVARYPDGYESSGDLAVIGDHLLATVNGIAYEGSDTLVSIDLATFETSVVGHIGFSYVYGLAAYGTQLFGYTATGQVLEIDPTTAKSRLLADTGVKFYGASAR
jgi:hypothetical protein